MTKPLAAADQPVADQSHAEQSDASLIAHIVEDFHVPHLRDLLAAIDLARKVEVVHAAHPEVPAGLTELLQEFFDHLSEHQAKEEAILFPMMLRGARGLSGPISVMNSDHDDIRGALERLAVLTRTFVVPADGCGSWRRLYELCGGFHRDLREHLRLEEQVLFPRHL